MATCTSDAGSKVEGSAEIRDRDGNLLVSFASSDAEGFWGNLYQSARIKYAMRHRRDNIPQYLRTGELPPHKIREAIKLTVKNMIRR